MSRWYNKASRPAYFLGGLGYGPTPCRQINTISDQLTAAVRGQELALAAMEERIASISAIADRNLQNAGETEQSSGSLAREAEALQSQVRKFILKEDGRG